MEKTPSELPMPPYSFQADDVTGGSTVRSYTMPSGGVDWKARAEEAERMLHLRNRQIATQRKFWLRDAKEALAGDPRALRNRVEMAETEPVAIVLS